MAGDLYGPTSMHCTYCLGIVVWDSDKGCYVHATDGERIPESSISPGDFVSRKHNRAGTRVGPYDIADGDPDASE